ncbi:MAG TPA: hypothetical protein VLF87_03675 [Patescibacteria group bacterium]|nr:hypothetical protein [Patescibacteria group bacterium]
MMSLSLEQGSVVGVPAPLDVERPDPHERFWFRYLSGDRVEVHHPFHGMTTLGDRSRFPDPAVDDAMVIGFQNMPYLVDSMKLSRIRKYETHKGAGEYAQLSHAFSLACIARVMGGGPQDILEGYYNDFSHAYDGHAAEDNYQGHGKETLADTLRVTFFERAGLMDSFVEQGVVEGENMFLRGTRLVCLNFLEENAAKARRSFLNNNHRARRLDGDRFQYNAEEDFYTDRKRRFQTEQSLSFVVRMIVPEGDEGEQLAYTDGKTAYEDSISYMRKNLEHWCEPVQDLLSDMLNFAERYFFVCDHPLARQYQEFYPRDYLYNSATYMFELFETVARDDPVMRWLLDTAERIASHQRDVMDEYTHGYSAESFYHGPVCPPGIQMAKLPENEATASVRYRDGRLIFVLPPGKVRTIDPRILRGNDKIEPVSVLYPDYRLALEDQQRYIGVYTASVEIDDKELYEDIARAVEKVEAAWPVALRRSDMPDSVLRAQIANANKHVLKAGSFTLKAAQ